MWLPALDLASFSHKHTPGLSQPAEDNHHHHRRHPTVQQIKSITQLDSFLTKKCMHSLFFH